MRKIRKTFLYLLMIAILTIQVYPIFWIFMTSLKTTEEVQKGSTSVSYTHLDVYKRQCVQRLRGVKHR